MAAVGFISLMSMIAWPPVTFVEAVLATIVFGIVGIVLAIVGFKMFDWATPGNLQEEVLQKNNLAAAIVAGAFVIGICIVVAAVVG
jgi:putative membrane protein